MTLAEHLAEHLAKAGHNPHSLAVAAAISDQSVRDVLGGTATRPRVDTLTALARALGLPARKLGEILYAAYPK